MHHIYLKDSAYISPKKITVSYTYCVERSGDDV